MSVMQYLLAELLCEKPKQSRTAAEAKAAGKLPYVLWSVEKTDRPCEVVVFYAQYDASGQLVLTHFWQGRKGQTMDGSQMTRIEEMPYNKCLGMGHILAGGYNPGAVLIDRR